MSSLTHDDFEMTVGCVSDNRKFRTFSYNLGDTQVETFGANRVLLVCTDPELIDEAVTTYSPIRDEYNIGYVINGDKKHQDDAVDRYFTSLGQMQQLSSNNEGAITTVVVLMINNGEMEHIEASTTIIPRNFATVKTVHETLQQVPHILILDGHSDGDRFHLLDGDICNPFNSDSLVSPELPPLQGVEVTIVNACTGIRSADRYNPSPLGLYLLAKNVGALITTVRVKGASVHESVLGYALLRVGCTFGDVVRLMNHVLETSLIDFPEYVLVGNPMKRLVEQQDWAGSMSLIHGDTYRITTTEQPIVRVPVVDARLRSWARDGKLRVYCSTLKKKLFYGLFIDDDNVELLFYSWNCIPREVIIRIIHTDELFEILEYSHVLSVKTQELEILQLCRPNLRKGPISRLVLAGVNSSKYVTQSAYNCSSLEAWFLQRDRMIKDIEDAIHIAGEANRRYVRMPLTDRYESRFLKSNYQLIPNGCPYCGKTVRRMDLQQLYTPLIHRITLTCAGCGIIEDRPDYPSQIGVRVNQNHLIIEITQNSNVKRRIYGIVQYVAKDASFDREIYHFEDWVAPGLNTRELRVDSDASVSWVRVFCIMDLVPWYFSIPKHRFEI